MLALDLLDFDVGLLLNSLLWLLFFCQQLPHHDHLLIIQKELAEQLTDKSSVLQLLHCLVHERSGVEVGLQTQVVVHHRNSLLEDPDSVVFYRG